MSRMMRSDRKPPLPVRSPIRLRSRGPVQSTTTNLQTPPGPLTISHLPKQSSDMDELELRHEYRTMSCELRALAKMVQENLGGQTNTNEFSNAYHGSPQFQRGRLYEEYSARRNEWLKKKKKVETALGVRIESAKRKGEAKKFKSGMKIGTPLADRREAMGTPRYSLRSSNCKENKKPPLASVATVERKTAVRRTSRK